MRFNHCLFAIKYVACPMENFSKLSADPFKESSNPPNDTSMFLWGKRKKNLMNKEEKEKEKKISILDMNPFEPRDLCVIETDFIRFH